MLQKMKMEKLKHVFRGRGRKLNTRNFQITILKTIVRGVCTMCEPASHVSQARHASQKFLIPV